MQVQKNNFKILSFLNLWLPVLVWALVIFSFSAYPTEAVSEVHWQDFIIKKTMHVLEYGVFAILLFRGIKESGVSRKKALLYSFLVATLYGFTDEFHQSFTPGREPKIRDVFFDGLGAYVSLYSIGNLLGRSHPKIKRVAEYFKIL